MNVLREPDTELLLSLASHFFPVATCGIAAKKSPAAQKGIFFPRRPPL